MNLKERINNIIKREDKELALKQDDKLKENVYEEVPSVVFENINLQLKVGQWLGVLNDVKTFRNSGFSLSMSLDVEDYIRSGVLDDGIILSKINEAFGKVLLSVGIDKEEMCVLNNYDENDFSFDLEFVNSKDKARISLRFGCMMDDSPRFIIDYKNVKRDFDYYGINENGKVQMQLQSFDITNPNNGNMYHKFLSPWTSYDEVNSKNYVYSLEVENQLDMSFKESRNFTYMLENSEELQNFLLNINIPMDFNELFKNICEICNISKKSLSEYPSFKLSMIRLKDEKKEKTINEIVIKNGVLEKFTLTKNGVTVVGQDKENFKCEVESYTYGMDVNSVIEDIFDSEILKSISNENIKKLKRVN